MRPVTLFIHCSRKRDSRRIWGLWLSSLIAWESVARIEYESCDFYSIWGRWHRIWRTYEACDSLRSSYMDLNLNMRYMMQHQTRDAITYHEDTWWNATRLEWRGLQIGGGNLIHRKVVFCIFRCQSIWVGISGDNLSSRIFWRNSKFQKTKWIKLFCGKRTLCCA